MISGAHQCWIFIWVAGNGQVKKFNNKEKILIYYYKDFLNYAGACDHLGPPLELTLRKIK